MAKKLTERQRVERFTQRDSALKARREPWEPDWQTITDYVQPRREFWSQDGLKGQRAGTKIYDGSPACDVLMAADGFVGYLINPSQKWFRQRFEIPMIEELPGAKEWIEDSDRHMYAVYEASNYYEQMHAYITDGVSIGTATMYTQEDIGRARMIFSARHPLEIYIAQNRYGVVDTIHRHYKMSAREIVKQFAVEDGGQITRELIDKLKNQSEKRISLDVLTCLDKNPDTEFAISHGVYPNEDRMWGSWRSEDKEFHAVYLLEGMDRFLREEGYDENPYAVWRWRTNSNEWYGRSPAHDALVEIMKLNTMGETMLTAAHRAADPPVNAPWAMRGKIKKGPGGISYYKNPAEIVQGMNLHLQYPIALDREDRSREIIKKHLKVEFFLMLAEATREMTATEIAEKQGEKAAMLAPNIMRLTSECLNPVHDRVFNIEMRAGRLPPLPESLIEAAGQSIKVDYLGPLAQMQRRLFVMQGIDLTVERALPIRELFPESIDVLDGDELMRITADVNGAPARAIHTEDEVAEIRAQRAKQMQMQQALAVAAGAADAAPKLSGAVEEGSIIDKMEKGAAKAM